jgi:hypothetical protein
MSTSEQHTEVTRHDPLADEPGAVDDRYATEGGTAADVDAERHGDVDPMLDRTPDSDGSAHRADADDPLADDVHGSTERGFSEPGHGTGEPGLGDEHRSRTDVADDELSRTDLTDETAPRTNGTGPDEPTRSETAGTDTDTGTAAATTAGTGTGASGTDPGGERNPLVSRDRADQYATRWNEVKGMFVDEPRQAVQQADALVGELLDDLERLFREQRKDIEKGLETDDTSTEDLRMALRRYRSFFDRLLSV